MLTNEAMRADNTCSMIDNDKHASRYMTVYDGICIVISIGHPWIKWNITFTVSAQVINSSDHKDILDVFDDVADYLDIWLKLFNEVIDRHLLPWQEKKMNKTQIG